MVIWYFLRELTDSTRFYHKRKTVKREHNCSYLCYGLPTFTDYWLVGITDGEGSFTRLSNSSSAYRFRYILTQKHEANRYVLQHILNLFNQINASGVVLNHSVETVLEIRVNGIKNCSNLYKYFDEYTLKTNKANSYRKWKEVSFKIKAKEHLDNVKRGGSFLPFGAREITNLCKQINGSPPPI